MNAIPSISEHIDEKVINRIIKDNFAALAPAYFTLTSNWFVRAYDHYKDIDKFVLIIYLIHQDLIYFRQNGVKINYDDFYRNKSIEIKKINISDISKDLGIPKESIRRKVLELEKQKVIKRAGKKIFIVRATLYSAKAVDTLTEVANILHEFNKILKKEKLVNKVFSVKEIILAIKENFSYCLYQFNKFWFAYILRWRVELKNLETLGIGMVVVINAVKNKDFTPKKKYTFIP